MKAGTESKAKFKKLQRRLGLTLWQTTGLLEALWQLTARDAPRGDIGKLSDEDIAATIEWEADETELISHLVETGWIDRCCTHRLVLHGWEEHAPNYIKGVVKAHKGGFATVDPGTHTQGPRPRPTPRDPDLDPDLDPTPPRVDKSSLDKTRDVSTNVDTSEQPSDCSPFWFQTRTGRWNLPTPKLDEYRSAYPNLDIDQQLRNAAMWLADNRHKRKTPRGMKAFLTGWLNRQQDHNGNGTTQADPTEGWEQLV